MQLRIMYIMLISADTYEGPRTPPGLGATPPLGGALPLDTRTLRHSAAAPVEPYAVCAPGRADGVT